jgi:hypothetical protein
VYCWQTRSLMRVVRFSRSAAAKLPMDPTGELGV